jgi:hypothetical protein
VSPSKKRLAVLVCGVFFRVADLRGDASNHTHTLKNLGLNCFMAARDSIRDIFLEEFEALHAATEQAFEEANPAKFSRMLEVVVERHGTLDPLGYLRAGYGLGALDAMQRFDVAEELVDRVLERMREALN